MRLLIASCLLAVLGEGAKLPPNFKRCNRNEPNFRECLPAAAQYAITQLRRPYKQLKLPNFEPLEIERIAASLETPLVNVSSTLTGCKFYGLTYARVAHFEFDFAERAVRIGAAWPKLTSTCRYAIDGRVAVLPIKGEGSSAATFKNFHWTFNLTYDEVKKDGRTYVRPETSSFDGKPEETFLNLEDLFDGDEELGSRANKLLNDIWSDLYDDVRDVYMKNAKDVWLQMMAELFSNVSLEEAFDN